MNSQWIGKKHRKCCSYWNAIFRKNKTLLGVWSCCGKRKSPWGELTNGSLAKCVCHINVNVIQMVLITSILASIVKPNEKFIWGSLRFRAMVSDDGLSTRCLI